MKKLFSFGKKKKGFSPNTSDTGSVVSAGYELKEKDLGKLHKAASTGDLSKLKQLAKKHDLSQLDKENRTPLHLACAHGHVDVVHFLTESKAKLNLCDNDNRSPLMKAVQCQQEHCAVTLLEHDADPNLVDINGNTALHLAALIPAISMAIQLLDHDARINATNKEGCTPLILAATENHQEMVEYLLKEGADVDAKDKSKRTSLMIAASNGQISLVRLLLRYDADISIKDDNGWTADDYAVMNGHHACSHLIIEHGTKKRPPQSPHGTSKVKGASVFSSPIRGTESGFAVGGPATDKEELQQSPKHQSGAGDSGKVGDNVSPDESISRVSEKDGAGDSWPSSDEGEELDFSPKKIQKPSLTKLMNASQKSKNNGTVCDEPGVLEKATTSRQSSAEQEENESENEEEDEDDEDEEEDEEEEGDEDEDEEDLEDEEEDEEEEASEEDDGGVASLEHENHERTEITVANLCSVVGETVQGQETISRGLDQTAAIGTSVAKGEVSAGEVVAGRDVSVNERGAADEVTGGDQLVADEESSEDQDIEVNEVVHSAVVGHESLSCHNDDGNAESPDRVSALADSWDSEEDNFKDEHPEPKADWQKMEETNDVPVSLIIGHYEGAFDLTTANSWNEMEGKNCKAQVSKIDDQTENIACEENSRNEEEVSQNSDLEIQDIQSGVCSSSVMGHHKHEEDNKESGEESEASVQEMKMEVTDIIEDSGANIMNSGKDSNDKEEVALKPSPSDNEEDSWDTDQEIQNCSEKLVQHKDREGDDFKSCQEKSDLSHGSRKWDEGAYSNTNDVNKSLEKGSNENEGPEIIIWDEDKQHQSVTKQGSNQDRKDAGDDLLDYSCEEKGNLMIHLQQNHSIQDIEKGSESDISWGERSGRPQEPEVFDVNMTSHPEPLQMDQENRVVRTTEKDRSKDFKLLKPAAEMEEYSEEEDEEEEEEEYEDLHISGNILKESGTVDSAVPQNDLDEKGSPEKNLKRDFLSELGLEAAEEDEDSLWDSESASDSPRKQQSGALNPAAKAQTVMHSISEEKNEDIFYIPSFLRGSRDYRMAELEDSRSVGRPVSRLRLDLGGNDTEKQKDVLKTPLKIKETVFSNLAVSKETREKQKTDFMEELGLDDADDIEEHEKLSKDASDWDSASIASRNLPGCKIPLPVHDEISAKLSEPELSTPQRKTPNVVQCAKADQKTSAEKSLSPSNSPPLPKARSLHSLTPPQPQPRSKLLAVKAESREDSDWVSEDDDVPSGTEQSGTVLKLSVQNFATSKPEPTDEELSSEEDDDRENSAHLKKKVKQVEGEKKKKLLGMQRSNQIKGLAGPINVNRQTGNVTEKIIQHEATQRLQPKGMQGSEKVDTCNQKDQKQLNNPRSNIKQRANATHAKRADLVSDEEDVDNKRISKLNTAGRQSQQATFVNGDQLSVFDDSTLSEMSEDGGRPTIPHNWKSKSNKQMETAGDFDDFTQSSDTATDSMESPTLGYRNASLLIKQLETGTIDSVTLIKIQNMFYDYERTIEREKGRYSLLSDKIAQHVNERKELQKALEDIQEVKSTLEHQQVEWETDLNNQKFILKQEQEKHKNAEMLYEKSREQLRKKEEQFRKEVEAKQQLELTLRNLEMEMRALISNMKQLEDERNELQRLLSQERSARALQEGILNNHLHRQKEIEEENKKTVSKNTEVFSQLSEVSDREKDLLQQNRSLQDEISVLKLELDRVRARSQEEEGRYLEENEALKEKMEDLKRDLKLNEEALAQTVLQYSGQLNALKTESTMMTSKMEQEKQNKDKLETDVESLRARLTSALQELERSQSGKVDAERTFQRERDEWLRLQEKHTHETTSLRDSINSLSQQLSKAEAKANSLENECHRATLSHTEKSLMLESMQREREQAQSRLKELEGLLQAEKEQASKSSVRQESMQERMAQAQSENIILRQQLEESQNKGIIKERAVSDVQDRFSDIITNLRADSEGRVQIVEERNKELMAKNIELREQVYRHQNEKAEREFITEHESSFDHKIIIQSVPLHYQAALRQLQQELADALKKLSMSEASLEVNTRYRNDLEAEKIRFQKDIDRLKGKLQETEDQFIQSEHRIHKLKSALDDKEREVIASSQKLQEILSASSGMEKTVKQLDEHIQRLEIENARLEATAKQQTNRIEVLQKEVHGSAAVQNRLEDLVTNLQGAKINLEEQLNQEAQKQSMLSHNAQDSHLLWEEELKSRSKLGLRLAQLEREKVEVTSQMETEKKKTKKIAELKRSTEARLDQEMKRNSELQKEINRMRTLVKTAKKKQKQQETGEFASQLSSIRGELDNRHLETGTTIARLKSKIDELSQQLEKESLQSTRLESTNNDLREQLSSMKALRKSHEKLERSKRQLEEEVSRVRRHIETNMMDHSQIEQCKREAEERARQEIRQKLEEVNLFLQTQAASQEALEQIKATNEATLRNQLEQRIRDLEGELSRARSTQQNSLSQRDSTQTELERYKELYSEEFKLRKSLAAKLDRSNERLAEANTKLLNERQRSKSFIASSIVNGSLTASPVLDVNQLQGSIGNFGGTLGPLHRNLGLGGSFLNPVGDGTSPNSRVDAYIAKMQNELEKNITKELDHATAELDGGSTRMSPVGSAAGSLKTLNLDQDPVTRATQQYLEVLKKNYMI
ncbi:ankyrin repeat domain-containing protein 26-like isoform X3 [Acipenser ruthenus]|uniref:ankyrin repeat domain-containing protein 26-like isoform X3 n=1 Tax=Acipenser ruthenus TaxID=7906 RepID=UPI0027411AD2|nr:ankyrin repeat domain-containing protein 26-like isoform X3 [Acipenser ruthenus]